MPAKSSPSEKSAANLGFEAKLWLAADSLRNSLDPDKHTRWSCPAPHPSQPAVPDYHE